MTTEQKNPTPNPHYERSAIEVGLRIRNARESRKFSLEEVQAKSKIDKGNLSRYENGLVHPDLPNLKRIAAAIGVPLSDLL